MILAIETSCDETAVCIYDREGESNGHPRIVHEEISSQIELHRLYGGVVPELASREHIKNLPLLISRALEGREQSSISSIAVTQGPGLKGCLLVGLGFAKSYAQSLNVPLIPVNHLEAHLCSGFLLEESEQPTFPILCLLVSGGHTVLVMMRSFREYEVLSSTQDDAAGEAFDKGAVVLGLPYPGGPEISRVASVGKQDSFEFPIGMKNVDAAFSFSGLKTALARKASEFDALDEALISDLAASYQKAIIAALVLKTKAAIESEKPSSFLVTGGVAANKDLRLALRELVEGAGVAFTAVPPKWCTDNAAMVARTASYIIDQNPEAYADWRMRGTSSGLGPEAPFALSVKPRWPIQELSK